MATLQLNLDQAQGVSEPVAHPYQTIVEKRDVKKTRNANKDESRRRHPPRMKSQNLLRLKTGIHGDSRDGSRQGREEAKQKDEEGPNSF